MGRTRYRGTMLLVLLAGTACASGRSAAAEATAESAAVADGHGVARAGDGHGVPQAGGGHGVAPAGGGHAVARVGGGDAVARAGGGPGGAGAAIEVLDPFLAERMAGLAERSRTWRAAMDTVRRSGFRVVVGRPADLRERVAALNGYQVRHFGEVVPLRDGSGRIVGVGVAIDVERVRRLVEGAGLPSRVVSADVDRILIHEIYGHVVPLAQSRRIAGGCPDPAPGAPASSSCAIRRENRIRAELGLELRIAYDLTGLAVGRYLRGMGLDEALRAPDRP